MGRFDELLEDLTDLGGIAELLGVSPYTPAQWRQRSLKGQMNPPLPDPVIEAVPLFSKTEIIDWAKQCEPPRWPPTVAARPQCSGQQHWMAKKGRRKAQLLDPERHGAKVIRGTNDKVPPAIFTAWQA